MPRKNSLQRREKRQSGALERLEVAQKRSPKARLARLDAALGAGVGAKKERAKLTALLEKEKKNAK